MSDAVERFTCPRCGMTSHNPHDIEEGYCGRCHDWTNPAATPYGRADFVSEMRRRLLAGHSISRVYVEDQIVSEEEIKALGFVYDAVDRAWRRPAQSVPNLHPWCFGTPPPPRDRSVQADEQPAPVTDVERRVNDMITDIQSGGVSPPDRTRLRGALDKADAAPAGRAAGDAALGRISKRGG